MQPENPGSRSEILAALSSVEDEVAAFFGTLSDDEFILRSGEAWTPAEHLKHLNTSVSAVARGFAISPWILRLRFGRVRSPSRDYEQVGEVYRARLAQGARATGAFVPPADDFPAGRIAEHRAEILARWGRVNARLRQASGRWSERRLDRVALPHPLLGKLTAREMLFFTLYHNRHHVEAARRRLPRFSEAPSP
jgi:hypothetical protein